MSDSDEQSWREEAESVIADVRDYVDSMSVSTELPNSSSKIYMNVTTFEKEKFCVELTAQGFRIVGKDYNKISDEKGEFFETPYSLLDSISPTYRDSFGRALQRKLQILKMKQDQDSS